MKIYFLEKQAYGMPIKGGRIRVKGEDKRKEYEKIGYVVVREFEKKKKEQEQLD